MATVLQKYLEKGWLKYGDEFVTEKGRMEAADRFYADFYKAGISDFRVPDLSKPRVDGGGVPTPDFVLAARDRWGKAYRALNIWQADMATSVICWDRALKIKAGARYQHDLEVAKEKLCMTLDALYYHYWGKQVPVKKHKIESMISDAAEEDFQKWLQSIR